MTSNIATKPNRVLAYIELMRFHRPVGIWLLLWPTLWSLWLAAGKTPSAYWIILFTLGATLMRAAGCVINDIWDYRYDKYVARTHRRPLASGVLKPWQAWLTFVLLCSLGLCLWWQLPALAKIIGVFALLFSMLYPLCKRFFPCPQLILGVSWYLGMIMAYATILGYIPMLAWLVYAAAVVWTLAYDTQYALADLDDDMQLNLHSSARLFGKYAVGCVILLQLLFTGLMWFIGFCYHLAIYYDIALIMSLICFIYQYQLMKKKQYLSAFTHNQWVGLIIFLGVAISIPK